jgi:hypothetical protein
MLLNVCWEHPRFFPKYAVSGFVGRRTETLWKISGPCNGESSKRAWLALALWLRFGFLQRFKMQKGKFICGFADDLIVDFFLIYTALQPAGHLQRWPGSKAAQR